VEGYVWWLAGWMAPALAASPLSIGLGDEVG